MKGMKKKGRGSEEVKRKISKKLLSVAIVAVLVSSVLIAFAPFAAAQITSFAITPDTGTAGDVVGYDVTIEGATGFSSLDLTIPAGFEAKPPEGGELLAEVWAWDNESHDYYMKFTANGTDKIDLDCVCGGDTLESYTFDASYGEGSSINISVRCWGTAYANLTLPTDEVDGSLDMSLGGSSKKLTKVKISIKEFVRNPATCGDYKFDLTVNGDTASDTVRITEIEAINVISPDRTYASVCVRLNFTVEPEGGALAWIGYSLDGGANVTIAGNTTVQNVGSLVGTPPYDHNIVVYANDTCGNMVASNTVFFTIHPGDITGDCKVDGFDLQRFAWAFLSKPGDSNWNEKADIRNCDNKVDGFDLQILAWNFLKHYPCPQPE